MLLVHQPPSPDAFCRPHQLFQFRDGSVDVWNGYRLLSAAYRREIDHLDGILILDRTDELFWVVEEETDEGETKVRLIPTPKDAILAAFRRRRKTAPIPAR